MPLPPGCTAAAPKPGVDQVVAWAGTSLAGFVEARLGPKAIPLAAAIAVASYQTGSFCAGGPPDFVQLTVQDYADLVLISLGLPATGSTALERFTQIVNYYAWHELCHCTNIATPAPTPFVEPPTAPSTNVGSGPPKALPCLAKTASVDNTAGTFIDPIVGDNRLVQDLTPRFLSSGQLVPVVDNILQGSPTHQAMLLPPGGAVNVSFIGSEATNPSGACQQSAYVRTFDASGAVRTHYGGGMQINPGPVYLPPTAYTFETGDHSFSLLSELPTLCTGGGYQLAVQLNCQAPGGVVSPCCPPDDNTTSLLIQIRNIVNNLTIASGGGSHAYTKGTAHTGLRNSGSLTVSGLRGIAADVTQGTPTTPQLPGVPPYEWNLGWLSVSNGDGMLQEQRLTRQHLVWLPPAMDLATSIGYFFNPGVVVNLTELLPA